jgi:RNA polymerase subunit RPABC4/transcription elongation factor Spt4
MSKICKECDKGLFEITKRECPYCHKNDFQKEMGGASVVDLNGTIKAEVAFFECSNCKIRLKLITQK